MSQFDFFPEDTEDMLFRYPCDNGNQNVPQGQVPAMAYVPEQSFGDYYDSYAEALSNGSLFKNLVKPFYGGKVIRR